MTLPTTSWSTANGSPPAANGAVPPGTTRAGLPRRVRGDGLQAELHDLPDQQSGTDLLDPEVVRARLSALSAGVASATRRNQTKPTGRPS
ncbi:hypothetical protein Jiend_42720 [Micromonospora endophytica]|nr:hypothetical protein [Micromonospora endophytica]BCJ60850.1 hypothetical protein Jiend_42720 [Micromonospora endophytica]